MVNFFESKTKRNQDRFSPVKWTSSIKFFEGFCTGINKQKNPKNYNMIQVD